MASAPQRRLAVAFGRLSTSTKIIAILSVALMPLGIVALLASLQSTRTADAEHRSQMTIAATEATRKLSTELASDIFVLKQAVREIDAAPGSHEPCNRIQALLDTRRSRGLAISLFGPQSMPLCTNMVRAPLRPGTLEVQPDVTAEAASDALEITVRSPAGLSLAIVRYSPAILATFAHPSGYGSPYRLSLDASERAIVLEDSLSEDGFARTESLSMPVGIDGLSVTMVTTSAPFGAAEALLTFLPLVMWASAAAIAFYVVDRLLIRPLQSLRTAVAAYQPGTSQPLAVSATPSVEIRELGSSFMAFADRLAERELQVEAALADQVRLTREVHHRVKNNLQVIASLISLHARDTRLTDAQSAYASIQRRVDALAIVHRNHFAELEPDRSIDLRALLGELASNFRAHGGAPNAALAIAYDADSLCVGQDTAMPLAFLFTELAELSMFADPGAILSVSARRSAVADMATLELRSDTFRDLPRLPAGPSLRIVEGLARQLRSPLRHDPKTGSFDIDFATMPPLTDR